MSKDEALKMAIKVIENLNYDAFGYFSDECANNEAIKACKEALEQPAQEPKSVGFIRDLISIDKDGIETYKVTPVYTHPQQWQGLTDDEIEKLGLDLSNPAGEFVGLSDWKIFARAIEQSLKEKNT
jgi:hypothetical protein